MVFPQETLFPGKSSPFEAVFRFFYWNLISPYIYTPVIRAGMINRSIYTPVIRAALKDRLKWIKDTWIPPKKPCPVF